MLTDIDKETIKSGNVGQLTDLLDYHMCNGDVCWFAEAQEFSESLIKKEKRAA